MGERMGHTEPFQSGQQTNSKDKGEKVPVKVKMSLTRNAGKPDMLAESLWGPGGPIPRDTHSFSHAKTSKPTGAHYSPAGEYGKPSGNFKSKATNYPSHTSRPGSNPLGSPQNARGDNPLGGRGGKGTFRGTP